MRTIICATAMAAAAGLATAAGGQECVAELQPPRFEWPVSEMNVTVSYLSTGYACVASCERTCSFTDSRKRASLQLWGCGNWIPQDGSWCGIWLGSMSWRRDSADGSVRFEVVLPSSSNPASGTVSIDCVPLVPMSMTTFYNETLQAWTVDGGVVATPANATWPIRFVRAGEPVVISRGFSTGDVKQFEWGPCPDHNANGTCDAYETLAADFGDFDASGDVGAPDLAMLLDAWGSSGATADLDDDGIVGASDLGMLLSRWGQGA